MHIFSSLVCYDAKGVPTGKEGIEIISGEIVESEFGKSLHGVKGGKDFYVPLWNDLLFDDSVTIGTQVKGFKWIEVGIIGRRWDNRFHDEDAKDSDTKVYRVSELIY